MARALPEGVRAGDDTGGGDGSLIPGRPAEVTAGASRRTATGGALGMSGEARLRVPTRADLPVIGDGDGGRAVGGPALHDDVTPTPADLGEPDRLGDPADLAPGEDAEPTQRWPRTG